MNRRWLMVVIVSLLAGEAAPGCQQAQSGFVPPIPVAVYDQPITKVVTDYEDYPGYTDSPRYVNVRARVSGYMTAVYFKDGLTVREGEKLFDIDPRPYKADRDRAKGTVEQLEAHKRRVEKAYNRAKNLLAGAHVSPEEYDQYEADYKETVANIEVARGNLDLAELSLRWTEILAPSDGLLSRRMVDPGNLVKADDTILTTIARLDPLYVYFDVDEVTWLRIIRLIKDGTIKVKAQGEKALPVKIGLSDEKDFPHEAVVDFTDNRVDPNTGTLHLRATLANPPDEHGNRFVLPGLFVRVRLQIGQPHEALLVREQALVTDQGRKTVFVVRPETAEQKMERREKAAKEGKPVLDDGKPTYVAEPRDVGTLGVLRDGFREIHQGIKPGEWVVVQGMQRLRPGILVKPEKFVPPSSSAPGALVESPKPQTKPVAGPDRLHGASGPRAPDARDEPVTRSFTPTTSVRSTMPLPAATTSSGHGPGGPARAQRDAHRGR